MSRTVKKRIICIIAIILVLALMVELYISNFVLTVSEYNVDDDIDNPIRIVQLTDLHNRQFGKNNARLIQKVKEQKPDYIFMTGDMISQNDELDGLISLLENMVEIAPVYFSYGNHEKEWKKKHPNVDLKKQLESTGIVVLDDEFVDLKFNGNAVRLGGYYGYYRRPGMTSKDLDEKEKILRWCQDYEDTERNKILLCHIPTPWVDWDYINQYPEDIYNSSYYGGNNVDLVFSGHYHGGQVRIPGIVGLYAPYVKWFPQYTKGIFEGTQTTCVLSSGLASRGWFPRVFNIPEIVVVNLK